MAHASGKFDILTEEIFCSSVSAIKASIKNVHNCMHSQIRKWFSILLLNYAKGNYSYVNNNKSEPINSEPIEIIEQELIQNYNLSRYELLVCCEMSIKALSDEFPEHKEKLIEFKFVLKQYCVDKEYLIIEE